MGYWKTASLRMPGTQIHPLISSPPDPSRLDRWKEEMSLEDVRQFEAVAGDALQLMGYALASR